MIFWTTLTALWTRLTAKSCEISRYFEWHYRVFVMSDKEQLCNKLDGLLAQLFATKSFTNAKKYLSNNYFFGSIWRKSFRTVSTRFWTVSSRPGSQFGVCFSSSSAAASGSLISGIISKDPSTTANPAYNGQVFNRLINKQWGILDLLKQRQLFCQCLSKPHMSFKRTVHMDRAWMNSRGE